MEAMKICIGIKFENVYLDVTEMECWVLCKQKKHVVLCVVQTEKHVVLQMMHL